MSNNWADEVNGGHDDEDALRRAIAMSLGHDIHDPEATSGSSQMGTSAAPPSASITEDNRPNASANSGTGFDIASLDRKKMEEERLARLTMNAQRKRKADEAPGDPNSNKSAQRPKLANSNDISTAAAQPSLQQRPTQRLQYPKGVVLKTSVRGVPRGGDDITIEEVFRKDELELAVLSSFQWDEEWLVSKLNLRSTKVLLIAFANSDAQKAEMRSNVPENVIRFVFPPMDGIANFMHSKLQLLKYPQSLRIVVPSGNLVPYDWGETGAMENIVFLIDLPRLSDPARQAANSLTPFGEELSYFLQAQGVEKKMIQSLRNYDFSQTEQLGFVHTIPGSHVNPAAWQRTGYCGLGSTIKSLHLDTASDIHLDYVCSSIGAVNATFLAALYGACQGDSGLKEYESRAAKPRRAKGTASSESDPAAFSRIRVYYPSRETVIRSRGGADSGGTVSFRRKWWSADSFPRQILRDSKNVRANVLLHCKVMLIRRLDAVSNGSPAGWAYVGSHNLSESAWGRLVKDRETKQPRLDARNWECGVVMPMAPNQASRGTSGGEAEIVEVFCGFPIPIELPGLPYGDDERSPWFMDEA